MFLKREALNAILYTWRKTPSTIFPHPIHQSESPCYHTFLTVTQSYDSNVTPIGTLHAEKMASAVLLHVYFTPRNQTRTISAGDIS